jgi:DNA-binding HxlR family transcriptional regulator
VEVRLAADLLERRWLLRIVYAAHDGATRFNEFRYALGDAIPPRTLATRLGELVAAGVLERSVEDGPPARIRYRLTEQGYRLGTVVRALHGWASERNAAPASGPDGPQPPP